MAAAASPPTMVNRNTTFLETELAAAGGSKLKVTLSTLKDELHIPALRASMVLGSSKHFRADYNNGPNEDCIVLKEVTWEEDKKKVSALFLGVFDGHGGGGHASAFVSKNLDVKFSSLMASTDIANLPTRRRRVEASLERAFCEVDMDLFHLIKKQVTSASKRCTKCRFFLEVPCMCSGVEIPANEGSTGTVLIITQEEVFCANIGDSDAVLVSEEEKASPTNKKRQKTNKYIQLTTTDTPLVDPSNEDFVRIKQVARTRRTHPLHYKAPEDGILVNQEASRFNYVSVPGARSLNMTRAFGNLGHKQVLVGGEACRLMENESSIIPRPHLTWTKRRREGGAWVLVVGSDGLWDNVDMDEVASVVVGGGEEEAGAVAKKLLDLAVRRRKKPDDISVGVVMGV
jgi:serine/threonine protein phosphatase PrpC